MEDYLVSWLQFYHKQGFGFRWCLSIKIKSHTFTNCKIVTSTFLSLHDWKYFRSLNYMVICFNSTFSWLTIYLLKIKDSLLWLKCSIFSNRRDSKVMFASLEKRKREGFQKRIFTKILKNIWYYLKKWFCI